MSIAQSVNNSQLLKECADTFEEMKVDYIPTWFCCITFVCIFSFITRLECFMKKLDVGTRLPVFISRRKIG